ncbi:adenylyltransferase/cytidyltransferase family protein [Entomospira culicis]|uniref:Adenylyltransferase/cytidyltransferase family protein n=1 Tax=Entomospira culicis TaxID=2719989 RepID=A0A968GGJ0_9SPIO|nr:adenylyltransferase/cytidyltransferase family protein [Entomospira culicis]NIZ19907.1 adenylyltransferase/cytidyltransferase family protein [Entomospira culicis]NIZ70136.1 adenylyltransferase/cytidyltransferase family protein [Entomospira culicis]WDI38063.1 adenylyltransferase/cytidyltransferase family protein [Entomospira culicis]WDI39686.1 adenylyltransferase/cytidyltransferase family protein [Entomospira culicis]
MKKVLTYGTFDLFHYGHMQLLNRAKQLGDHLTVGLSSDRFNQEKGKTTVHPYALRYEFLSQIKYIDAILCEESWEQKIDDIQKNAIDIFVMGDDWQGKFDFLQAYCQVIYLPRTPDVSSTQLKNLL